MGETQDVAQSEGEEMMHLDNQSKASAFSETEAKSEDEAQVESVEHEKHKSEASEERSTGTPLEENPRESSESGDDLAKSGEEVIIQKTPLENGSETQNENENGNRSTVWPEENQREREVEQERPQLQVEIKTVNRVSPVDLEFSNVKDVSDNGGGQGEGEAHISNFNFDYWSDGDDSGTEEEQNAFMKEVENFYQENNLEFKPPKFYGEGLNLLK